MNPLPFPHLIYDNWWNADLLRDCFEEFQRVSEDSWIDVQVTGVGSDGQQKLVEVKKSISFERAKTFPAAMRMKKSFEDENFIDTLEEWTGIGGLKFDPLGGGLHRIVPGGLLAQHIDFNVDDAGRWRRVNVLIYLNECNGGELQLANVNGSIWTSVKPRFNRMVAFECSETSWHGHPKPLGPGPDRYSLAAYYFTEDPPPDAAPKHQTIFRMEQL